MPFQKNLAPIPTPPNAGCRNRRNEREIEPVAKSTVYFEADEDGMIVASCPSLPGCISQGSTREEARSNIREAVELYLESLRENGDPVPPGVDQEFVEVKIA
jgi:predicted RNase H-like HicB family nuclease